MSDDELKQVLIDSSLVSNEELQKAIGETKKLKRPLEKVILDMHILDKGALYKVIAQKTGSEYKDLTDLHVEEDVLKVYPEDLARNTQSVPLFIKR